MEDMLRGLSAKDTERLSALLQIEEDYETGKIDLKEARRQLSEKVGRVHPYDIAKAEQHLVPADDEECRKVDMKKTLQLLDGFLDTSRPDLPTDHPIMHYYRENDEMRKHLAEVENLLQFPLIKNQWLELYEALLQYPVHYTRKQNQLYPLLEKKGFDRPTTTMWTFDDFVRDEIKAAKRLLDEDQDEEFLARQKDVLAYTRDLMEKEETILYPTSLAMISPAEFEEMKEGDREIGFAFIEPEASLAKQPTQTSAAETSGFAAELQALLGKYGYSVGNDKDQVLEVKTGKLTLEQINLIFRHLPVDISFVDENELVKFYSDTPHRVFPRSKNVIGRQVTNCHPRSSVHIVREIVDKFRNGEQDKAEFWINKPGLFIYIIYYAVRDEAGRFRGVLEMMQDCTHIRDLEGSRTLLTWEAEETDEAAEASQSANAPLSAETRLKDLLKTYPWLKAELVKLRPEFKMLNSPLGKLIVARATLKDVSERSGMSVDELLQSLQKLIAAHA